MLYCNIISAASSITNALLHTGGEFKEGSNNVGPSNKTLLDNIQVFKDSGIILIEQTVNEVASRKL